MSSNTNIGNTPVNQGYVQLIHTGETGGIDGTLRTLYDGDGTASDLQIASNKVKVSTELYIGSKTATEFIQDIVGDMFTTGSYTNITTTYDDTNGNIDLSASGEVTLTGTQTLTNKTLASPTFTGTANGANLTLSGDLTVNGTTTTLDTTNLKVTDNLIELNQGVASNANDSGIIIERGSTGDNAIIMWDESADKFTLGTTTATADATGNIIITTGTLVASTVEANLTGNVTGNVTGSASLNLLKSNNLSDLANAATARTNLGVDAAGTDNSTDVTLAGTLDYITIAGQTITRNAIDLTTDVTGTLPVGNGGTGLTSISTLLNSNVTPTSLGLVIGTDVLAQQTIGIANDNLVEIDDLDAADNDYAKFTANGLEGRSYAEVRSDLSLGTLALQSTIDFDDINGTAYITSAEAFSDSDLQLMTAAAIDDLIVSKGYGTGNGDITAVTAGVGIGGGGLSGDVDLTFEGSELPDMTDLMVSTDEFVVLDGTTSKRKAISEIRLTAFDDTGFTSGISFNGSTANGLLTYGNSTTADVESGLTFDGTLLHISKETSTTGTTGTTFLKLTNDVGSDLSQQQTFVDFTFLDDNSNETPQVRIGAQVGQNGDANTQQKEGSGAFVVYTNNADTTSGDAGASLAERMRVDYQGRVGIGTTSPQDPLHVTGSIRTNGEIYLDAGGDSIAFMGVSDANYRKALYSTNDDHYLTNRHTGGDLILMSNNGSAAGETERLRFVAGSGTQNAYFSNVNVGIGTTSPAQKLHVVGNTMISNGSYYMAEDADGDDINLLGIHANNNVYIGASNNAYAGGFMLYGAASNTSGHVWYSGNAEAMRIDSSQRVGIGTNSPGQKLHIGTRGTASDPTIATEDGLQFDFYNAGSPYQRKASIISNSADTSEAILAFWTTASSASATQKMTILGNGNVGIGTTSPEGKVHIYNGDASVAPDSDGDELVVENSGDSGISILSGESNGNTGSLIFGSQNDGNGAGVVWDYYNKILNVKTQNTSGILRFASANNSEAMRILANGNVGIGTSAPSSKFHVDQSLDNVLIVSDNPHATTNATSGISFGGHSNGNVYVDAKTHSGGRIDFRCGEGTEAGYARTWLQVDTTNGQASFVNDVIAFATSDERLKENVKNIESPLEKISKINGVTFDWIYNEKAHSNSGNDIGVIAQEIEEVLPEVVTTRDSGYKAVKYEKIVPLLIEAIKEQQQQINKLEEKLNG